MYLLDAKFRHDHRGPSVVIASPRAHGRVLTNMHWHLEVHDDRVRVLRYVQPPTVGFELSDLRRFDDPHETIDRRPRRDESFHGLRWAEVPSRGDSHVFGLVQEQGAVVERYELALDV